MVNKEDNEHLEILKQGVKVWNKWRNENPDVTPDLSKVHLSDIDLTGANLANAFLMNLSLLRVDLSQADLSNSYIAGASFYETNFKQANLIKADLSGVEIAAVDFSEANLSNANLSGITIHKEYPGDVTLSKVNLSKADLSYAELFNTNFSGANLNGSNFTYTDLSHANFSNANLSNTNLYLAKLIGTNFQNTNLTGVCIKDWHISYEINLETVICEYIYIQIEGHYKNYTFTERRPIKGNFEPGEFARLYKKIIENTDLILSKTSEIENTVNNQGVQFLSNQTIHTWEKLRFRSKTEIKIAEALDRAGVLFLPNSLARLNTPNGRENKEADFLICYNGKWGVLEVDGPHHTAERRVEEQERERIFKKNGIKVVERFDAARCYQNPDEVVQEFFKMIEIGYS